MEPLISVIVPVYKVEQYLAKCVDSILNQTYRNLEVILVDDGSPDHCGEICDAYAGKDSRVKVIHQQNGGQSSARNAGMAVATGEYVSFVDSDDWVDCNLYNYVMESVPFDISVYGVTYIDEATGEEKKIFASNRVKRITRSDSEAYICELMDKSLFGYACNKIYRRTVIDNLEFKNLPLREDLLFNLQVFDRAENMTINDCEGYNYLQRQTSTLHAAYSGPVPQVTEFAQMLMDAFPRMRKANRTRIANMVVMSYILDVLYKYVFMNRALSERERIEAIENIFHNRRIVGALQFSPANVPLRQFFVFCAKIRRGKLFYHVMKRKWHV